MKVVVTIMLTLLGSVSVTQANESTDRRVQISLPLFPRIVAVDNKFQNKLTADNKARLVFVYDRNKTKARELAKTVGKANKNIVNVQVDTVSVPLVEQLKDRGRLVIPVGSRHSQALLTCVKKGEACITDEDIMCVFVPLIGEYGWVDN